MYKGSFLQTLLNSTVNIIFILTFTTTNFELHSKNYKTTIFRFFSTLLWYVKGVSAHV